MKPLRGLQCPVIVPSHIDWGRDYSSVTLAQLVGMQPEELAAVDPLAMNLIVAKGIPRLANLDIGHYQTLVNSWVTDFSRRCLPQWEPHFHQAPQDFDNDIRSFLLGMVCQYLELEIGIQYNLDQRDSPKVLYTNPNDLFLNGVLDTHEGTCGNMAALQVAFGWRMGWPVSLACVNSHFILRFDDGTTTYNIETTTAGHGGYRSDPDAFVIEEKNLPPAAISSGSELRALRPHEMLGQFVGLRARHFQDVGKYECDEAKVIGTEPDWLLARQLCPSNRVLYKNQLFISALRGETLFEPREVGHPNSLASISDEIKHSKFRTRAPVKPAPVEEVQAISSAAIDALFSQEED